jgi:molybdopterin-guanine dinucleotide biosynthesis protein A
VTDDRARVRADGVSVVEDRMAGAGSLGGLYTALVDAPTDYTLVLACDMPFLTAPFLAFLAARGAGADAAVPRDGRGRHPLCASYARRAAGHFRRRIEGGDLRVVEALAGLDVRDVGPDELASFDPDGRLLTNVNTVEDHDLANRAADDRCGREPAPKRTAE